MNMINIHAETKKHKNHLLPISDGRWSMMFSKSIFHIDISEINKKMPILAKIFSLWFKVIRKKLRNLDVVFQNRV